MTENQIADAVAEALYDYGVEDVLVEEDARTDDSIFRVEIVFPDGTEAVLVVSTEAYR